MNRFSRRQPASVHRYSAYDLEDDETFEYNNLNTNYNLNRFASVSPSRDTHAHNQRSNYSVPPHNTQVAQVDNLDQDESDDDAYFYYPKKWIDVNGVKLTRLREQRNNRLLRKIEQFDQWDNEELLKQRQFEVAREQRYRSILERLKSQEFCCNTMRKRHEEDIENTRNLELYENDHLYVDALDDPKANIQGPLTQYRRFEAEMTNKQRSLQEEMDSLNPRFKIEQVLLPRLQRNKSLYLHEPTIYTSSGKRVLKRPLLSVDKQSMASSEDATSKQETSGEAVKFYYTPSIRVSEPDDGFLERIRRDVEARHVPDDPLENSLRSLSKLSFGNNSTPSKNRRSQHKQRASNYLDENFSIDDY